MRKLIGRGSKGFDPVAGQIRVTARIPVLTLLSSAEHPVVKKASPTEFFHVCCKKNSREPERHQAHFLPPIRLKHNLNIYLLDLREQLCLFVLKS